MARFYRDQYRTVVTAPAVQRVLIDIHCDRCGHPIQPQQRMGDHQDTPGQFAGDFACLLDETWAADLCTDCTTAVRDFIDAGAGPGVTVTTFDPMGG